MLKTSVISNSCALMAARFSKTKDTSVEFRLCLPAAFMIFAFMAAVAFLGAMVREKRGHWHCCQGPLGIPP